MRIVCQGELMTVGTSANLLADLNGDYKRTDRFKCDYRREKARQLGRTLDALLVDIVTMLAANGAPPDRLSTTRSPASEPITATAMVGRPRTYLLKAGRCNDGACEAKLAH